MAMLFAHSTGQNLEKNGEAPDFVYPDHQSKSNNSLRPNKILLFPKMRLTKKVFTQAAVKNFFDELIWIF